MVCNAGEHAGAPSARTRVLMGSRSDWLAPLSSEKEMREEGSIYPPQARVQKTLTTGCPECCRVSAWSCWPQNSNMGNCATAPVAFDGVPSPPRAGRRRKSIKSTPPARAAPKEEPSTLGAWSPDVSPVVAIGGSDEDANPTNPWGRSVSDEVEELARPEARGRARRKGIATLPVSSDVSRQVSGALAQETMRLGLCGLRNYGNTCFVNAVLQCLSHTRPLANYFLSRDWQDDVNPGNKLGHGGALARAFGDVISRLWLRDKPVQKPEAFLQTVFSCAGGSDFGDGNQHDAHEFLSFLLDGLHEDLNGRVGRGDMSHRDSMLSSMTISDSPGSEAAVPTPSKHGDFSWMMHLQHNNSFIGAHML